jgi:hypothetical protein
MKETPELKEILDKLDGIESYFIWDMEDPNGFAEVSISAEFETLLIRDSGEIKFKSFLDCISDGCGTISLNWESDLFNNVEEAILDLGKIFNDGLFIRDNLTHIPETEFWVGPSSDFLE